MGWVMLSLRRSELQNSIADINLQIVQLSNKRDRLLAFSSAIGDGVISPSEIASFGSELFSDAMDFTNISMNGASALAQEQTDYYANAYQGITQQQYYNNPAVASQASLYFDPATGAMDTNRMYQEFYEEALEEFVQEYMTPKIKEIEKELEKEQTQLQTELQVKEAELDSVKSGIEKGISSTTIQL